MIDLVNSKEGSLHTRIVKLTAIHRSTVPTEDDDGIDILGAVLHLFDVFKNTYKSLDLCDPATVPRFVDYITMEFALDKTASGIDLMTLHSSKGLSWKNVYLMQPHEIPLEKRIEKEGTWEELEERSLAHVAASRAEDNLYYLKNLTHVSRDSVASLWDAPVLSEESSQTTHESSQETTQETEENNGPTEAEISNALHVIGLEVMPADMVCPCCTHSFLIGYSRGQCSCCDPYIIRWL